jgi:taurine dioxygenase/sulfonate dioxygenase
MAPSISQVPTAEVAVPVKVAPETTDTKPRVRRIIDEEGGKTTASVGDSWLRSFGLYK